MFLKQYNYKPRTGSQSGGDAQSQAAQAAQASTQQPAQAASSSEAKQGSISAAAAGRRRSSAGQFAGLQGYKRSSQDESRSSFGEQQQQSGVLGQMWDSFTKGK